MKQYGYKKATEFTKKQISVLYFKAKSNELQIEKWFINELYDLADFYNADDNGTIEYQERFVLNILDKMFKGDTKETQAEIEKAEHIFYDMYTSKAQKTLNRNLVA